jgi:hypothetical protein
VPKVDNDPTKTTAKPFLIIAGVRCGGTFLAHSLSNHPDVFCDRGESMHEHSLWRQHKVDAIKLLRLLTHQEGYLASGFRMVYSQAFNKQVWRAIVELKPHVIHLTRKNVLRQAASFLYQRRVRAGKIDYYPVHTFKETGAPKPIAFDPAALIRTCQQFENGNLAVARNLRSAKIPTLNVEYSNMLSEGVTQPMASADVTLAICNFLGVSDYPLTCSLKRVHSHPLRSFISNWADVEEAIANSDFSEHLAHEMRWVKDGGKWRVRNG